MSSITVRCLAAYTQGILHDLEIELDALDVDDIREHIQAMLKSSPVPDAEEWQIVDWNDFPRVETTDPYRLVEIMDAITEHGINPVIAYLAYWGEDEDLSSLEHCYLGFYWSERDFIEERYEHLQTEAEKVKIGEGLTLASYIDWESLTRDKFLDTYISFPHQNGVQVFSR